MKNSKGYTLLELVLAISLVIIMLAAITGGIAVSMRIFGRGAETVTRNSRLSGNLYENTNVTPLESSPGNAVWTLPPIIIDGETFTLQARYDRVHFTASDGTGERTIIRVP